MKTFLFPITLFLFFQCSSPTENAGSNIHNLPPPQITGIYITDDVGNLLGTWGNPAGEIRLSPKIGTFNEDTVNVKFPKTLGNKGIEDPIPFIDIVSLPYPNPFKGSCRITYHFKTASHVSIWVSQGEPINALIDNSLISGAFVNSENNTIIIMENRKLNIGFHSISIQLVDNKGRKLPSGYYRVYLKINEALYWRDVLFFKNESEIPTELKIYPWL